jgi:hypothetical protein
MIDEKGPRMRAFFCGRFFVARLKQKRGKSGNPADDVA